MFRAILCQLIVCATASAATYYVSPEGNDRNSGTSEDRPFRVVQHAIDRMQAGDTTNPSTLPAISPRRRCGGLADVETGFSAIASRLVSINVAVS